MCYIWTITLIDPWEYPFAHFLPHGNPTGWPFLQETAPSPARSSAGRAAVQVPRGLWWWPSDHPVPWMTLRMAGNHIPVIGVPWVSIGVSMSFYGVPWISFFPMGFMMFYGFLHPVSPYDSAKYPQHLTPGSRSFHGSRSTPSRPWHRLQPWGGGSPAEAGSRDFRDDLGCSYPLVMSK